MSGKGNYLSNKLLDHALGGPDYTRATTVYLALFTASPSGAGGGTEVTGGSYARAAVTNNATNFPAASSQSKSLGVDQPFPTPTASWGSVVAWGIFDASTSGNLLYWGPVSTPQTPLSGNTVKMGAGGLTVTES